MSHDTEIMEVDTIGGFPYAHPDCACCGQSLTMVNAWMTDGCPCNSKLGVNSMNETRWRLLMQLQQEQSHRLASCIYRLGELHDTREESRYA